jgi:hypothetical protein
MLYAWGEREILIKFLVGKLERKSPLRDLRLDRRIILKRILGKLGMGCGTDFELLRIRLNGELM